MSLGKKVFAAPARLWMNWPLWGGLLAVLLLAKHVWVLFAPAEHAVPGTTIAPQSAQAEQLFGTVSTTTTSASINGIRPIGIFASRKNGFAVMMTETGQIGVGLGGEVVPGVRLVETQPEYVILERNGMRQRVDLGKAPATTDGITQVGELFKCAASLPPAMRDCNTSCRRTVARQAHTRTASDIATTATRIKKGKTLINSIVRRTLLICGLAIIFATPCHAEKPEEELVSLNFVNADIQEVIRAISQISKKNFLVDPRVKGTINIVSATPVSPALGYDILLSALRLQGYAAVESNGVTQIIPEADAKLHVDSLARGRGDTLITRVFILKYESASQLVNIVRPMISPNNVVVAYPSSNALVVTDYASSVRRIEKLIEAIDQPNADAPLIIPVKHASAVDLANIINRLMPESTTPQAGGSDDNQRFILVADSRTNTLLLRSDNPGRIARVKELVAKLDDAASTPGNIHVVQLKNTDATKLAQTLRSVMSGETSAVTQPGNTLQGTRKPPVRLLPAEA